RCPSAPGPSTAPSSRACGTSPASSTTWPPPGRTASQDRPAPDAGLPFRAGGARSRLVRRLRGDAALLLILHPLLGALRQIAGLSLPLALALLLRGLLAGPLDLLLRLLRLLLGLLPSARRSARRLLRGLLLPVIG